MHSSGFLGRNFGLLLKTGLQLMKKMPGTLAKLVLIPFGLTAAPSAADVEIYLNIRIWTSFGLSIESNNINGIK